MPSDISSSKARGGGGGIIHVVRPDKRHPDPGEVEEQAGEENNGVARHKTWHSHQRQHALAPGSFRWRWGGGAGLGAASAGSRGLSSSSSLMSPRGTDSSLSREESESSATASQSLRFAQVKARTPQCDLSDSVWTPYSQLEATTSRGNQRPGARVVLAPQPGHRRQPAPPPPPGARRDAHRAPRARDPVKARRQ